MSLKYAVTIRSVELAMKTGEYLKAFDQAEAGLRLYPDDKQLQYFAVLSLARQGATEQAKRLYKSFELGNSNDGNHAALAARLIKDRALRDNSKQRLSRFLKAAESYEQVFHSTKHQDYYPAVNAASMYFLAGELSKAKAFAELVLSICRSSESNYWVHASLAEAYIVLGDSLAAIKELTAANEFASGDWSSLATTKKQLELITDNGEILSALKLPRVIHYAGHIISAPNVQGGRFPADQQKRVTEEVRNLFDTLDVGIAYGSLAAGADIIFAEEIIERYGELHVALPFSVEEFKELSVASAGADWLERFDRCWEQATTTNICSSGQYKGDDSLFNYCSLYSMGRTCLRQQHLSAPVSQVVVWDGQETQTLAGTYTDKQTWSGLGRDSHIIFSFESRSLEGGPDTKQPVLTQGAEPALSSKQAYSILFGDIKGFSALPDAQLPKFVRRVLGCIAGVLEDIKSSEGESAVLMANTWGDGLFVVMRDTHVAAKCSLAMQHAIRELGTSNAGFEHPIELRLGVHFGPIYEIEDPVTKRANYFGEHVNMAARIEPITPPREVYVTESFAAQLALSRAVNYRAEYVGIMPMAKDFGELRMYLLREYQVAI